MPELNFDRPLPELTDEEDEATLAAIDRGIRGAEEGRTVSIEEARLHIQNWLIKSSLPKKL
jgi:predicted transcriptional regulator